MFADPLGARATHSIVGVQGGFDIGTAMGGAQKSAEDHGIFDLLRGSELLEVGHEVSSVTLHGNEAIDVRRRRGVFNLWDETKARVATENLFKAVSFDKICATGKHLHQ